MWLLIFGPLLLAVVVAVVRVDWKAITPLLGTATGANGADLLRQIETVSHGFVASSIAISSAFSWAMFAGVILYPVFQAVTLRWWASGLRFGGAQVTSHLQAGPVFGAYARFIGIGILFSLVVAVAFGIIVGLTTFLLPPNQSKIGEIAVIGISVLGYLVLVLGYSTIQQVVLRLGVWRLVVESLEIDGISALDHVSARGKPSSAFGEGLADALNVGGL
jgi:hypothetical protein